MKLFKLFLCISFYVCLLQAMEENQAQVVLKISAADIKRQDNYSGYYPIFDQLYQKAKRDLHLVQEHQRIAECHGLQKNVSYKSLEQYFLQLQRQRAVMAGMYKTIQAVGEKYNVEVVDQDGFVNEKIFDKKTVQHLQEIENELNCLYSRHIQYLPWPAQHTVVDGKISYDIQLQINDLDLERMKVVAQACCRFEQRNR